MRRYELLHVVRTHMGAHDEAYRCVYQQEDDAGIVGMRLDKVWPRPCARLFVSCASIGCRRVMSAELGHRRAPEGQVPRQLR